jgi:hypothetical protein
MALVALWAPRGAMRGRDSRGRNSRPDSEIRGGVSFFDQQWRQGGVQSHPLEVVMGLTREAGQLIWFD